MGNLGGHVIPGSIFILLSLWWSWIASIRYVQSKMKSPFKKNEKVGYNATITMPCICLPCARLKRAPIESYMKLLAASVGVAIEVICGMKYADQFYTNRQHSTMYSAFLLSSIVEILVHYRYDVPKHLEYATNLLGYVVEAFLFAFHLNGRDLLDVHLHTLLVIAIFGCIIFFILEMWDRSQVLFTFGRIAFVMFQGTWFFQVGFVLYPPTDDPAWVWDRSNHMNIMTITMVYCWHFMLIVIVLLLQMWIIKFIYMHLRWIAQIWDELIVIDDKNRSYIATDSRGHEAKFLSLNNLNDDDDDDDDDNEDSSDDKVAFDGRRIILGKHGDDTLKLLNIKSDSSSNNNNNNNASSTTSSTSSGHFSASYDKHIV